MGRKLKVPAAGLASEKPVEATNTVADQATALVESPDESPDEPAVETPPGEFDPDGEMDLRDDEQSEQVAHNPLMQRYQDAKKTCGDALLLFRIGDFYELFFEDAKIASNVLGLTLTSQDKGDNSVPITGFPYHQLENYLAKLIMAGHRAAFCEQADDAASQATPPTEEQVVAADVAAPATEQPSEPASQPTDSIPQEHRDAFGKAYQEYWQQFTQWENDVEAAKEKHTSSAIVRSQADDARKAAKAEEDDALEDLMDLLNSRPAEPTFAEVIANLQIQQPTATAPASSTNTAPESSIDWRSVSITKLDLPEKLIERLQEDGIDTIGRLEDRRGEISEGKAKWPKGIGEAKITKIEDAVVAWLTANRDQGAFQELSSGQASPSPAEESSTTQTLAEGQTTPVTAAAETPPASAPYSATPDEVAFMQRRALELNNGERDCLDSKYLDEIWEEGFTAFQAGKSFEHCGYRPSQSQDDWLRGWLSASKAKDWHAANGADAGTDEEPPTGEEPELQEVGAASGPMLFDPDDI